MTLGLALHPEADAPPFAGAPANPAPREVAVRPRLVINGRFVEQQITGVQKVCREVVQEIDDMVGSGELDLDVVLVCPPEPWTCPLDLKHITIQVAGRFGGALWEQFVLPGKARGAALLCLGNTAPVATLLAGTCLTVMIHDLSYLDHPEAYRLRYRISHRALLPVLLKRATRLITVSETERERLEEIDPSIAGKLLVAPNGGWGRQVADAEQTSGDLPASYLLYVGSFSHRKNFTNVLSAAFRLAREEGRHVVFVGCIGKVMRSPQYAIPDDVRDKLHFVGQVDDPELLAEIYAGANILLFPSLHEASPLPPLEAARFDCAVVASNIPSIWERCGETVRYCDPHSVESIVAGVKELLANEPERRRLVELSKEAALKHTWKKQARAIVDWTLYERGSTA